MKKVSIITKAGAGAVALAVVAGCVAGRGWAFNPQPDPPGISGLVGIVEGQTARLNALNRSNVPIRVVLNFLDADGNVLKRSRMLELQPGHGASLDVTPTRTEGGGDGSRFEVYGDVVLLPAVRGVLPPDPYVPTMEVFDGTGRTSVFVANFHNPPSDHNPPGD